jgi:hypothetical protein
MPRVPKERAGGRIDQVGAAATGVRVVGDKDAR